MTRGENKKVLIVDDSALMRKLIGEIADGIPGIEIGKKCRNGRLALQEINLNQYALILLDIEMPVMNGLEFLTEKKAAGEKTPVMVISSLTRRGAETTFQCLEQGAIDFIAKPAGLHEGEIDSFREEITRKITGYLFADGRRPRPGQTRLPVKGGQEVLLIGISTGGPNALRQILPRLSGNFILPIVIVQHMPAGFTGPLADNLDSITPLHVKESEEGEKISPGTVYIAQGGKQLGLEKGISGTRIRLANSAAINSHKPSFSYLVDSAISTINPKKLLILVMTGMGKDGAQEVKKAHDEGTMVLCQDEKTSIVFGMPGAVYEMGACDHLIPLHEIPDVLETLTL